MKVDVYYNGTCSKIVTFYQVSQVVHDEPCTVTEGLCTRVKDSVTIYFEKDPEGKTIFSPLTFDLEKYTIHITD